MEDKLGFETLLFVDASNEAKENSEDSIVRDKDCDCYDCDYNCEECDRVPDE